MQDKDGNRTMDKTEICNNLQDQYVLAFNKSKPLKANTTTDDNDNQQTIQLDILDTIEFTTEDIENAIGQIPDKSAPGPDGIAPKILKECKATLSISLHILWMKSLETGEIPDLCKQSFVVPTYKRREKDKPENYGPITYW